MAIEPPNCARFVDFDPTLFPRHAPSYTDFVLLSSCKDVALSELTACKPSASAKRKIMRKRGLRGSRYQFSKVKYVFLQ